MGKRLYVGNLPYDADEAALRAAFAQDGRAVERVHIVIDRETQRPRGFAFVEMGSPDDSRTAIEALNGREVEGRTLTVSEAKPKASGSGGGRGFGGDRGR